MSNQLKHIYEFGPFRLDAAERLLLRDGAAVPLTPRVFDLLLVLREETAAVLEVSPDTVMRDWQLAKIWLFRELSKESEDEV